MLRYTYIASLFFVIKPTRCTNVTNLFWHETTYFGQFLFPSSGVYSLYTQQWYMSHSFRAESGWFYRKEICYDARSHERKIKVFSLNNYVNTMTIWRRCFNISVKFPWKGEYHPSIRGKDPLKIKLEVSPIKLRKCWERPMCKPCVRHGGSLAGKRKSCWILCGPCPLV